jgi:hypothetical protein
LPFDCCILYLAGKQALENPLITHLPLGPLLLLQNLFALKPRTIELFSIAAFYKPSKEIKIKKVFGLFGK